MKNQRRSFGLSLVVVLALVLTACAGSSKVTVPLEEPDTSSQVEDAADSNTNTPGPTDSPGSADSPEAKGAETGEEEELDATSLAPATDLKSYRSTTTIYAEGIDNGQAIEGTIEFFIEYARDPLAQHTVISSKGFEDSDEALDTELYILKDTTYMRLGGEWFSTAADSDKPLDDAGFVTSASMLGDTCGWKQQGNLEHNGIAVYHWTLTHSDFAQCITPEKLAEMGDITAASGNLYVTADSNHLTHLNLDFEGQGLAMGVGSAEDRVEEGRIDFRFEMTDIDQPFTIQLPEEALASNAVPEDIPIPDDAEQINNMFGMITFLSASTPDQVADHFKTGMSSYGWTQVGAEEFGGTFVLEYSKGPRTASLMISTDQDANKTSVLITLAEE